MRIRTAVVVLLILLMAAFAALNWSAFIAPAEFTVLFTTFRAPLGLLLLGVILLLIAGFALYMTIWQGQLLSEMRQLSRDLEKQRVLADQAEASRIDAVGTLVRSELQQLSAHVDSVADGLRVDLREQANSLAAALAEMDDRLGRPGPA